MHKITNAFNMTLAEFLYFEELNEYSVDDEKHLAKFCEVFFGFYSAVITRLFAIFSAMSSLTVSGIKAIPT